MSSLGGKDRKAVKACGNWEIATAPLAEARSGNARVLRDPWDATFAKGMNLHKTWHKNLIPGMVSQVEIENKKRLNQNLSLSVC